MRTLQEARTHWDLLENCSTLSELDHAITYDGSVTEGLRSACWKAFLIFHDIDTSTWPTKLDNTRAGFESLRARFLRQVEHPDEADSSLDPLSDDLDSPWEALRKDEALRQEINQDVERCMPDNLYFRRPDTQAMLLDILFVWAKLNPDIGYRQGMHELLAPIIWVVERDAIDTATSDQSLRKDRDALLLLFDADFIGHDSFTLFTQIMRDAKASYELSDRAIDPQITANSTSAIVSRSQQIVEDYLGLVDPPLASHLKEIDVVPQVYLIRWIRLLFGREFPFDQVLMLWDRLFAAGNTTVLVDLVCVAMLLRIRWDLIDADYNTALQCLLRFPKLPSDEGPPSLVDDALFLRNHLNFDGGCEVIKLRTKRSPSLTNRPSTPPQTVNSTPSPSRHQVPIRDRITGQASSIESLLNDAARGINIRGEKWGVYKAVRDVAGEVRKNVSTIQSKTHSRMHSRAESSVAGLEQGTPDQLLRKIDTLNARNQALGKMLEGAVTELWEQQQTASSGKAVVDEQVESFTATIAKVQFVQIYLEDSTLELPEQEPTSKPASLKAQPKESPSKGTISSPPKSNTPVSDAAGAVEGTDSRKQNATTDSLQPPNKSRPVNVRANADREGNITMTPPSKANPRPSLEHSSFSWMLGQEPQTTPRHAFISASPFSDHSTRKKGSARTSNAFLFGDEDDSLERRSSTASGPKEKGNEETEDMFRLGNLSGKR